MMENETGSREAFETNIESAKAWLDLKLTAGDYAPGLLFEIAGGMALADLDPFPVFDAIGRAEKLYSNLGNVPRSLRFERPPLKGLCKIHYVGGRFLLRNIINEISKTDPGKFFDKDDFGKVLTGEIIRKVSHRMVIGTYERRAREGRLTGEWLVFKHDPQTGKNLYLTLASHSEQWGDIAARADGATRQHLELLAAINLKPGSKLTRITEARVRFVGDAVSD